MSSVSESSGIILKILNGVQAGVDVALLDGDYTLGSGDDDDIQIFDVSMKPGHARIAVRPDRMEIAGAAGQLRTQNGLVLEAGGDLQEIEALDIVTAGTTRFALGPRSANWVTITEADHDPDTAPKATPRARPAARKTGQRRLWPAVLATGFVLAVILAGAGYTSINRTAKLSDETLAMSDLAKVEEAIAPFDFRNRLDLREEVDGTLYLNGFVDGLVERRAVLAAISKTGVPVRIRIAVLDQMRNDISNLLAEEEADVGFDLSTRGELKLTGVMLDADKAAALVELVEEQVSGLAGIRSQIRTSQTLLAEVEELAGRSQINPLVLLRLDGELIEASGVIPTEKIDNWVGFLQSYASNFAPLIGLRSFVQLQNPDGTLAADAGKPESGLFLGPGASGSDVAIDVNRLKTGNFELNDVFAGGAGSARESGTANGPGPGPSASNAPDGAMPAPGSRINLGSLFAETGANGGAVGGESSGSGEGSGAGSGSGESGSPGATAEDGGPARAGIGGSVDLNRMGREVITRWQKGTLGATGDGEALMRDLDALQQHNLGGRSGGTIESRYAPLLAEEVMDSEVVRVCWQRARLNHNNIQGVLFWLDLMSVSRNLSLADFAPDEEVLILEAAFNPKRSEQCIEDALGHPVQSAYFYEISRNPDFVRYITRDVQTFPIDIAGVSIAGDRYVQTRAGRRMPEGSAPDQSSRLLVIGELGAAFRQGDGFSAYIYGNGLNWRIE